MVRQITYDNTGKILKHREVGNLPKITGLRSGNTERSGNLPNITQLKSGSTERSGNLLKITKLRSGSVVR